MDARIRELQDRIRGMQQWLYDYCVKIFQPGVTITWEEGYGEHKQQLKGTIRDNISGAWHTGFRMRVIVNGKLHRAYVTLDNSPQLATGEEG